MASEAQLQPRSSGYILYIFSQLVISSIISKKQRDTLTAALAKIDTEIVWPRATLAAFLIQDQPSLTALDKVVEASKVELVVTVVFNCHKFIVPHVSNSTHYGQTLQANCNVSLQLWAYASQRIAGMDWILVVLSWCCC